MRTIWSVFSFSFIFFFSFSISIRTFPFLFQGLRVVVALTESERSHHHSLPPLFFLLSFSYCFLFFLLTGEDFRFHYPHYCHFSSLLFLFIRRPFNAVRSVCFVHQEERRGIPGRVAFLHECFAFLSSFLCENLPLGCEKERRQERKGSKEQIPTPLDFSHSVYEEVPPSLIVRKRIDR